MVAAFIDTAGASSAGLFSTSLGARPSLVGDASIAVAVSVDELANVAYGVSLQPSLRFSTRYY